MRCRPLVSESYRGNSWGFPSDELSAMRGDVVTVSIPDTDSLSSLLAEDSTDKSFQQIGTIVKIWMRFLVVVAFVLE